MTIKKNTIILVLGTALIAAISIIVWQQYTLFFPNAAEEGLWLTLLQLVFTVLVYPLVVVVSRVVFGVRRITPGELDALGART